MHTCDDLMPQLCAAELVKLRELVEGLGGQLGDGWRLELGWRNGGKYGGTYHDKWYYPPDETVLLHGKHRPAKGAHFC